jgi:hypothetical protein
VVTVHPGGLPADGEGWRTVRSPAPSGARIPLLALWTPAILSIQLIMMAAFLAGLLDLAGFFRRFLGLSC